ncbi:MAG: sigma-70 family RNA polymerase sigma factor [Pirellulales bacterium]|nr:sigma-70 family RNA polymerase sigma factor [Pirellulales bacterium]
MNFYAADLHRIEYRLSPAERTALARRARRGDRAAREQLIESILPLVVQLAKRWHARYPQVPIEDLIQAGNLGAIKAVDGFRPSRGFALTTYAFRAIQQNIRRFAVEQGVIRVPYYQSSHQRTEKYQMAVERARSISAYEEGTHDPPQVPPAVHEDDRQTQLREGITRLPARLQRVIELRLAEKTYQEIGEELGVSKERIRQLLVKAHKKLRESLNS